MLMMYGVTYITLKTTLFSMAQNIPTWNHILKHFFKNYILISKPVLNIADIINT